MTPEEYLDQLRKQLEGFSPEERASLLDEITSHIESGEEDPTRGRDSQERLQRVMAEIGSPEQMGSGFKQVYRPNRFLNVLIAFLPSLFLLPLVQPLTLLILGTFVGPEPVPTSLWLGTSIRASILISGFLILLSLWRRSVWLLLFWIPETVAHLITLLSREGRWALLNQASTANAAESAIWYVLLAGLTLAFIRLLWVNRRNFLLVNFALLPILMVATGYLTFLLATTMGFSYIDPTSSTEFIIVNELANVAWIPLFFIPLRRNVRWLALALSALFFLLKWDYLFGLHALPILLSAIPLLIVAIGWRLDVRGQHAVIFRW
jgi:hypothetical protein